MEIKESENTASSCGEVLGENVREAKEALNVLAFSQSQKRKRRKQSNDGMHQSPSEKHLQSGESNGVYCCCFLAHVKQRFPGACLVVAGIKREEQPQWKRLGLLKWDAFLYLIG